MKRKMRNHPNQRLFVVVMVVVVVGQMGLVVVVALIVREVPHQEGVELVLVYFHQEAVVRSQYFLIKKNFYFGTEFLYLIFRDIIFLWLVA